MVNNLGRRGKGRNKSTVEIELKWGKEQKRSKHKKKGEKNRDAASPPQSTSS